MKLHNCADVCSVTSRHVHVACFCISAKPVGYGLSNYTIVCHWVLLSKWDMFISNYVNKNKFSCLRLCTGGLKLNNNNNGNNNSNRPIAAQLHGTKMQCLRSQTTGSRTSRKTSDNSKLAAAVSSKLEAGNFRAAVRIISSSDTPAPTNQDTLNALRTKHPGPPATHQGPFGGI